MTAQEYLLEQLQKTKQPLDLPKSEALLEDEITRLILSKKFRKYSVSEEQANHIKSVVSICVKENKAIQGTLVFGGYKLWRLQESPKVDWAELFALMYYTNWMKPICEIYKPGVWFDFFSDDVIVPIINNISTTDTEMYQSSFKKLLEFVKPYQPDNLTMTLNRVGDQYDSYEAFEKDLNEQIESVSASLDGGLPVLNDAALATLDLNVKVTERQKKDSLWHEKVQLIHDGYAQVKGRRPYYRTPDKFNVFTTPFPGMLSVGTTKDSIMKFWVGAGALRNHKDSLRQIIMSPNQLSKTIFQWEKIKLDNLVGENFEKIRVL